MEHVFDSVYVQCFRYGVFYNYTHWVRHTPTHCQLPNGFGHHERLGIHKLEQSLNWFAVNEMGLINLSYIYDHYVMFIMINEPLGQLKSWSSFQSFCHPACAATTSNPRVNHLKAPICHNTRKDHRDWAFIWPFICFGHFTSPQYTPPRHRQGRSTSQRNSIWDFNVVGVLTTLSPFLSFPIIFSSVQATL